MEQKSIKKNFLMNIILTMSSFIFPLITFPYVSRILQPSGTGKVAFVTSIVSYFALFSQLGIPMYGIRVCAQVRDNWEKLTRTAHELLAINFITSLIVYVALTISIIIIPKFHKEKTLFIIVSSGIILSTIGIEWLYKALEQYTYVTIRSIVFKFIALILLFLMVHEKKDYIVYGFITIFAASASNILNLINAHKYIGFKPIGGYDLKRHIKPVIVFFAMSCATTIYTNLDVVMLGFITSDTEVGYYNAAVKIKTILVSIVTALGSVVLPRASYYIENKMKNEFVQMNKKALSFVIMLAVPLTVYFMIYAKNGILFLSGQSYTGSILPMQIIMPTLILIGITNILGIQILVPIGREKVVLYSEVVGAITDIIINTLLIPDLRSVGAAIGTLMAEIVVFIVQYFYLRNNIKWIVKDIHYSEVIIGTLLAVIFSMWLQFLNLSNFITLLISAVIFIAVYILYMLFRRNEILLELIEQILYKLK